MKVTKYTEREVARTMEALWDETGEDFDLRNVWIVAPWVGLCAFIFSYAGDGVPWYMVLGWIVSNSLALVTSVGALHWIRCFLLKPPRARNMWDEFKFPLMLILVFLVIPWFLPFGGSEGWKMAVWIAFGFSAIIGGIWIVLLSWCGGRHRGAGWVHWVDNDGEPHLQYVPHGAQIRLRNDQSFISGMKTGKISCRIGTLGLAPELLLPIEYTARKHVSPTAFPDLVYAARQTIKAEIDRLWSLSVAPSAIEDALARIVSADPNLIILFPEATYLPARQPHRLNIRSDT